jgi:hypothetical protein
MLLECLQAFRSATPAAQPAATTAAGEPAGGLLLTGGLAAPPDGADGGVDGVAGKQQQPDLAHVHRLDHPVLVPHLLLQLLLHTHPAAQPHLVRTRNVMLPLCLP